MSRHTFVCLAGKRLEVKPSPTSPGHVLLQILSADRVVQGSLTVAAESAGVVAQALEICAREAVAELSLIGLPVLDMSGVPA